MDIKELTDLLVTSSQRTNQSKFIPWWEDDFENCIYRYDILKPEIVQEANTCLEECGKEVLLAPTGTYGLTLFHLLIWHNFYNAVEKMLLEGKIEGEEINIPDHKGYGLTPFMLACCRGNFAMASLLLRYGANDSLCDKRGMNAYHFLTYPRFEGLVTSHSSIEKSIGQRRDIARLLTCDINQKDENGFTPLVRMLTTSYNSNYSWALTEVFLEKGAETNYIDEDGNTLLMIAIKNNHITATFQLMEKHKEIVNIANKDGITPIQYATDFHNEGLCLALVDYGASPINNKRMELSYLSQITSNAFAMASNEKDGISLALYLAKKLIQQVDMDDDDELGYVTSILYNALISDTDLQILDSCNKAGLDFLMPIHFHGSTTCIRDTCLTINAGIGAIQKMLELGVDMEQAVIKGQTPVNIIASINKPAGIFHTNTHYFEDAAKLFSKESMEQLDNNGKSAIHMAAQNGHTDMLKIMIEKGININLTEDMPSDAGTTALHEACTCGHADIIKLLIDSGADDTLKNLNGETPAHFAVINKKYGEPLPAAKRAGLLKELKNLDIPRADGKTPLMLLQLLDINTAKELLPIFIDRGVDLNHTDNNGMTTLMIHANNHCYKDIIKELMQAGADINIMDNKGNTVLYYVLKYGDSGVARYLIKKGANYNYSNNQGETPMQIAVEKGYDTVLELMTDIE